MKIAMDHSATVRERQGVAHLENDLEKTFQTRISRGLRRFLQ
jgi:hypothetical protein